MDKSLNLDEHITIAFDYFSKQDYNNAIVYFNKILEINPALGNIWANKACCYYAQKLYKESINCFEKAVNLTPLLPEIWFNKSLTEMQLNKHIQAMASLQLFTLMANHDKFKAQIKMSEEFIKQLSSQGIKPYPKDTYKQIINGLTVLLENNDTEKAIQHFNKSSELTPQLLMPWQYKGTAYFNSRLYEQALQSYTKCTELDPENPVFWYYRGIILGDFMKRVDEAIECFNKSLQLYPDYVDALIHKAKALKSQKKLEESSNAISKALEYSPDSSGAWLVKANIEEDTGQKEKAVESYKQFVQIASPIYEPQIENAESRISELNKKIKTEQKKEEPVQKQETAPPVPQPKVEPAQTAAPKPAPTPAPAPAPAQKTKTNYDTASAREWVDKGIELLTVDQDEAYKCYVKSLEFDPEFALAWFHKGFMEYKFQDWENASASFENVIKFATTDEFRNAKETAQRYLVQSKTYLTAKSDVPKEPPEPPVQAAPIKPAAPEPPPPAVQPPIQQKPVEPQKSPEAKPAETKQSPATEKTGNQKIIELINKGDSYSNTNQLNEALFAYDDALKLDPKLIELHIKKAGILFKTGRFGESVSSYDDALKIEPGSATVMANKSEALFKLNKFEETIKCAEDALKLDSNSAVAWCSKGAALNGLKKYKEAIPCFDNATTIDRNYANAWYQKGISLRAATLTEDALVCFMKSCDLNPAVPPCWYFKGELLRKLKRYEEASKSFDKVIELEKNNNKALELSWYFKATCQHYLKQYAEAVSSYNNALMYNPEYPEAKRDKTLAEKNQPPAE